MNEPQPALTLNQIKLLADARRQEILHLLIASPSSLSGLSRSLGKSPAWARHHIQVLEAAGLVEPSEVRAQGRKREKVYRARVVSARLASVFAPLAQPDPVCLRQIGVIHTPFREQEGMPIQASRSDAGGEVEVFAEFAAGLESIEDLSHLMLFYIFHKAPANPGLMVKPFLDDREHGVFATRFYQRPNPLGFSIVRLLGRQGNILRIHNVDMLDGTPLIDIKPYVPEFDQRDADRLGWYATRAHR